jgi:hypothetical protein
MNREPPLNRATRADALRRNCLAPFRTPPLMIWCAKAHPTTLGLAQNCEILRFAQDDNRSGVSRIAEPDLDKTFVAMSASRTRRT